MLVGMEQRLGRFCKIKLLTYIINPADTYKHSQPATYRNKWN